MRDFVSPLAAKLRFHEPLDEPGILSMCAALIFRLYVLAEKKVREFGDSWCGSSDGLFRRWILAACNQP
ncbi:hypothetical protein [Methylobacterium sp. 10]|uniref:hypothetical protein n=1 Tax=Methylobacterium sp. 10 TaxID=1101191 RepID=UPI0018CC2BCB|nr:hypothetical protein [Methylobacterium sp. 10]